MIAMELDNTQNIAITIGAAGKGGAPGEDGEPGGSTSFGSYLTALGGEGGDAGGIVHLGVANCGGGANSNCGGGGGGGYVPGARVFGGYGGYGGDASQSSQPVNGGRGTGSGGSGGQGVGRSWGGATGDYEYPPIIQPSLYGGGAGVDGGPGSGVVIVTW